MSFVGSKQYLIAIVVITTVILSVPGIFDRIDDRPLSEQMAEARQIAKEGHQVVVNRALVKSLQPGDIILWQTECSDSPARNWIVLGKSGHGFFVQCLGIGRELHLQSSKDIWKLKAVYHKGTPEWHKALEVMANEAIPSWSKRHPVTNTK